MKKTLFAFLAAASLTHGASIDITNYGTDYPHTNIFTTSTGTALNGSFVGVGYFSSLSDVSLAALDSSLLTQITTTSEFVQLAPVNLGTAWVEPGGLSASVSAGITGLTNSSFIGKGIYVVMGNQPTLAASTELLIAKSGTFAADAPVFAYTFTFDQAGGGGNANILWGSTNTNTGAIGGGTSQPAFSTLGVGAVPEPSRAMLAAMGLFAGLVRRRRK